MAAAYAITAADVATAQQRIGGLVHRTPVVTCSTVDALASTLALNAREAFFKCELFQKSGSFKARGACNAVMSLSDDEAARGVCTHSSGNHAQALAIAAKLRGVPAHIVMPRDAPATKRDAVKGYGGKVIECEPTQAAREAAAAGVAAHTGARFVHPSEDPLVIAGQGTLALELLEQVAELTGSAPGKARPAQPTASGEGAAAVPISFSGAPVPTPGAPQPRGDEEPPLDAIIVPIGGGGMIAGVATAVRGRYGDRIRIIAAEPAEADDAFRSKAVGRIEKHVAPPATAADGLKTTLGPNTWPIVRDHVERVVRVSEADIIAAMRLVYSRMKLAIEPSAAVGVAALLSDEFKGLPGIRRVGVVLCGGNVDIDALPWMAMGPAAAVIDPKA
jgi:threonine dehydratase